MFDHCSLHARRDKASVLYDAVQKVAASAKRQTVLGRQIPMFDDPWSSLVSPARVTLREAATISRMFVDEGPGGYQDLRRRGLVIAITALAILGATVAYFLYENPCSDLFPCHDSPSLVAVEERELLQRLRDVFHTANTTQSQRYNAIESLPKPLSVHVSGVHATLMTAGTIAPGSLEYAQSWYDVYHTHHRGTRAVDMRVIWNSGSLTQKFPLSEF